MENIVTDNFFDRILDILKNARKQAKMALNISMVYSYYEVGRAIIEEEQNGKQRAEYGKAILKELSKRLTESLGKGFSVENLKLMRRFYVVYSKDQIGQKVSTQFENLPVTREGRKFFLSFSPRPKKPLVLRLLHRDDCGGSGWRYVRAGRSIVRTAPEICPFPLALPVAPSKSAWVPFPFLEEVSLAVLYHSFSST